MLSYRLSYLPSLPFFKYRQGVSIMVVITRLFLKREECVGILLACMYVCCIFEWLD